MESIYLSKSEGGAQQKSQKSSQYSSLKTKLGKLILSATSQSKRELMPELLLIFFVGYTSLIAGLDPERGGLHSEKAELQNYILFLEILEELQANHNRLPHNAGS